MFESMFLLFKVSLLLVILGLFIAFLCFSLVVLLFQTFDVGLVVLFLYFDIFLGVSFNQLLVFVVLLLLAFVFFLQLPVLLLLFHEELLIFCLILLFLFYMTVFNGLDNLVKSLIIGLSHFTQLAETSLFQLNFVCIVFFYCLSLIFVLELQP